MSKRGLAGLLGISESFMSDLESGWRSATPAMMAKLARALDCPEEYLKSQSLSLTPMIYPIWPMKIGPSWKHLDWDPEMNSVEDAVIACEQGVRFVVLDIHRFTVNSDRREWVHAHLR